MAGAWLWRVVPPIVAMTWVGLLLVTPAWRGLHVGSAPTAQATVAALVDMAASRVCHRQPGRSFHLHGQPLPVCGRCLGLYVSGAAGLLAATAAGGRRRRHRLAGAGRLSPTVDDRVIWMGAAGLPTLVTWTLDVVGAWDPGTPLRALAALPLGAVVGWIVGDALARPRSQP